MDPTQVAALVELVNAIPALLARIEALEKKAALKPTVEIKLPTLDIEISQP